MSVVASMTGFASVEGTLAGGRGFTLTVKSVNHRHLDLQVRVPMGFDALEAGLRKVVKAGVKRGHVELTVFVEKGSSVGAVQVDEGLLDAYVAAYRKAAERYEEPEEFDLNALLRMPGVMSAAVVPMDVSAAEEAVLEAAQRAVAGLNGVREAEGAALAAELRAGMERLSVMAEEARVLRAGVAAAQVARLRERLAEMLVGVPEDRVVMEAALLVERGDVEEELVRLRTHIERFIGLLDGGGELGRQLDFLLQELNREANTMLSKTGGSAGDAGLRLTELGLAIKVELERAREQVQNLE
ncbi:YicC/YloC family endoribonuclease [Granulicella tundricola]|uniref:YicC-like domain-containing protein n=1 Tax=Granulicella tundricola (strain ATCC BAA-1859 / DSM 23138 / MP5ACTX9) TaxID=1198114 RepID=E8WWH6_GRATM|nr:YicC/YloC family endoribonuclease [Granulicella tundricola]ADW69640.1 YicC-like domain-containing protein [Granulicella tundricola MP5ACTX9]